MPVESGDPLRVVGGHLKEDADAFPERQVLRADHLVVSLLLSGSYDLELLGYDWVGVVSMPPVEVAVKDMFAYCCPVRPYCYT